MSFEETPFDAYGGADKESVSSTLTPESIEEHAQTQETIMNEREADLLRTLDTIQPETPDQERILEALKERTLALSGPRLDLKVAAQTAALSVALEGILSANSIAPEGETYTARLLANNPELTEMLMQRILGVAEGAPKSVLIDSAKEVLAEMEGSDSKLFKGLALRTAERAARALISASTLGIGTVVYDSAKDLYISLRERSVSRTKQRLTSSTAIPAV